MRREMRAHKSYNLTQGFETYLKCFFIYLKLERDPNRMEQKSLFRFETEL